MVIEVSCSSSVMTRIPSQLITESNHRTRKVVIVFSAEIWHHKSAKVGPSSAYEHMIDLRIILQFVGSIFTSDFLFPEKVYFHGKDMLCARYQTRYPLFSITYSKFPLPLIPSPTLYYFGIEVSVVEFSYCGNEHRMLAFFSNPLNILVNCD